MNYNDIYSSTKNVWGTAPNKLIQVIINDLPKNSNILDLGSGQGRDVLDLSSHGCNVVAVEKSEIGHNQLKEKIFDSNILNITPVNEDIFNFEIEKDKFTLIMAQNVLQFLQKNEALSIVKKIKSRLRKNGYIIIKSFTVDDPLFNKSLKIRCFFEKQELLNLFSGFEIIYYFENQIIDKGHGGHLESHTHGVVRIIAKKVEQD